MNEGYNGWKNYETWNVALYINNDYGLYLRATKFMTRFYKKSEGKQVGTPYMDFIRDSCMVKKRTPDGVKYSDKRLDLYALDKMMFELVEV